MKRSLQACSLLALLTLSLPFALAGCNSSTDSTMTSSTTPPADTNMAAPAMTPAPAMDTNTPATSAPAPAMDSTKPASTNTPGTGGTTNSM